MLYLAMSNYEVTTNELRVARVLLRVGATDVDHLTLCLPRHFGMSEVDVNKALDSLVEKGLVSNDKVPGYYRLVKGNDFQRDMMGLRL